MARDTIPISAQALAQLAALGVDVERVAARAGLAALAGLGGAEVTTEQYFAFWRALSAEAEADRPELGLLVGAQSPVQGYSVASAAALQAPTLGDGLRTLARYKRLACPEEVAIDVGDGEARVRCTWILATEEVPRLLVDGVFASIAALARHGSGGKVAPIRVELARRARHARMLRAHFGCRIAFGAPADCLVFAERALGAAFVTADAEAFSRIAPGLEQQLIGRRRRVAATDDVRVAIARTISAGVRPSIGHVARHLRTSPRTLQRRLGEVATTFQHQLDDVRRLSARRLLAHTELDTIDIAFLLGFAEPNSFARAFRTWERTTPLRWRAARG
jgi:AraC-like DNA-binding protein